MPRLEDVADVAGVSHQTVSRVVNNHPNVSKATREKVEAAIAELGYRRNTAARSLVTRRSQTIGVLASELSQYGPANTLLGVEQAAREAGYFVSIAALREVSGEAISDAVNRFMDQSVDGIVALVPHSDTLQALGGMQLSLPVVAAGSLGNSEVSGAMVDQRRGAGSLSSTSSARGTGKSATSRVRRTGRMAPNARKAGGRRSGTRESRTTFLWKETGVPAAATTSAGNSPPRPPLQRSS